MPHVCGFACFACINPAGQLADQCSVFFTGEVRPAFALLTTVYQQGHILMRYKATRHSFFKYTVHG